MPKRSIRALLSVLAAPFVLVGLYLLAAAMAALVPLNTAGDIQGGAGATGVDVYLQSNGVHTDLVLPLQALDVDWTQRLPMADLDPIPGVLGFLAFGWGDRGFYLTTPSWADLRLSTAVKALTGLDDSVIHVEAVAPWRSGVETRHLRLSPARYHRLVAFVEAGFQRGPDGQFVAIPEVHYSYHDAFFAATGHYSVLVTCNEWARRGLAEAGVRVPLWAPFDRALFYQLAANEQP